MTEKEREELVREVFLAELGYSLDRGEEEVEYIQSLDGTVVRGVRVA